MAYTYSEVVTHSGLNKCKVIKASTQYELNEKVRATRAQWDEQWKRKCEAENKRKERLKKIKSDEDAVKYANERTIIAEAMQNKLDSILIDSLKLCKLDFESLKDKNKFPERKPIPKELIAIPREPNRDDSIYNPTIPFIAKLFKTKKEEFISNNDRTFMEDHLKWENTKIYIEKTNQINQDNYNKNLLEWENNKKIYLEKQAKKNNEIDIFESDYIYGKVDAIQRYYLLGLQKIDVPFDYEKDFTVEYNNQNKILIIDVVLPIIENIPSLKKVTYVKSREEYTETYYPESYIKKKYDSVIYQIVLAYINYVLGSDKELNHIDAIAVNGIVNTIDKSTGNEINPCILSITVPKQDFIGLNLTSIDPKLWFKSAKGISAASFATVTPVAPIIAMSREDSRFVDSYSVVDDIDDSVNLAAIDWKDFENLIREIFEKEFNVNGGEVKITQASRDGGVDAVAFDPDPIRGGKIVIQAKRYTNVVGVSAVRDLYGTVMNEGATKGILVTTSNYGNDAYAFANGKPLTLLSGAELLYLLEKHGHKARIDLKEAKEYFKKLSE